MYDLAIIGGGPAAVAAGVYASRKRLTTVLITESFGGQSVVSDGIENWIGTVKISGADLAKSLETHLKAYAGDIVDIKEGERAEKTEAIKDENGHDAFRITTQKGATFDAKTVLVTTGSQRRKLNAIGADIFEHKGLTYCATCDGPLYSDQDVVVIGGGNAGFESAAQLAAYCKTVTIIHKNAEFKADPVTVAKVLANPKVTSILNADILEVKGEKFVNGLVYKSNLKDATGAVIASEPITLPVTGIFVEIGAFPATDFVKDVVDRTPYGAVVTNPKTQQTSRPGIWAAGDCTDALYHQNNIAAGDAVKALEDIYLYIHAK